MNTFSTSSLEFSHFPVMLNEVIKISNPKKVAYSLIVHFGGGGYSQALLKFPKTKVIAIDRDPSVLPISEKLKNQFQERFKFFN